MPLEKSASQPAFVRNLKTELKTKPRDQALAIAYSVKRRSKRAKGGKVHTGPIISDVAGRTDHHAMDVPSGAYVLPAHVVSGLGEGNTLAGMKVIDKMFPDPKKRASGGPVNVPIMAAGGEVVLSPEQIKAKFGDVDHGHLILDHFVKEQTKSLAKEISKLPPPAQD